MGTSAGVAMLPSIAFAAAGGATAPGLAAAGPGDAAPGIADSVGSIGVSCRCGAVPFPGGSGAAPALVCWLACSGICL